jgi:UDP-glucose 4-epimerase
MMAEAFARSFDLPVAILRPFNTFGPRQSERAVIPTIIRQALDPSGSAIRIGDPTTLRDFTFVEDTAEAFLSIGIAPQVQFGRPYNAGSGKAVTIRELLDLILHLTKCDYPVEQDLQRMRPVNSEVRALLADSARLTEDTGWRPSVGLSEGLERTISWWRNRVASGLVRRQKEFIT